MPYRSLGQRWERYRWHLYGVRQGFDQRHPRLRWLPFAGTLTLLLSSALALLLNTAVFARGLDRYLLALVVADSGLVATEVMALLVGRAKWMEEGDVRYLLFAIAFAALPAWGALEGVCVSHLIPEILTAGACQATRPLAWIAVVWLGTLPIIAVLFDFWRFQSRRVVAGP